MKKGRKKMAVVTQSTKTTRKTNEDLCLDIKSGSSSALDELVANNMGLVKKIAKSVNTHGSMDDDDLVQSGIIALIKAARNFSPSLNCRFTTYAWTAIDHYIRRDLCSGGYEMRLPSNLYDRVRRLSAYCKGKPIENVEKLYADFSESEKADGRQLTRGQFDECVKCYLSPDPIVMSTNDDEFEKLNFTDDGSSEAVNDALFLSELMRTTLTEKESDVLKMRYGIGGKKEMTLRAVGKKLSLSAEGVRFIENKAMEKLRNRVSGGAAAQ